MRIEAIERLVQRLEASDITDFALTDETGGLTLRLAPGPVSAAAPAAPAAPPLPEPRVLRARAIGRLRLSHPEASGEAAFPRAVAAGDIVAFLEAGPLLRPVVAEADGTLGAPLMAEGSLVGYGMPVFPLL